MHQAQLQKSGFIILPYGTTLARFLSDKSLEVFWSEEDAAQKLDSELIMTDLKHLPEIVPIHITIPLSKVQLQEPQRELPNGRRIRPEAIPAFEVNMNQFAELAANLVNNEQNNNNEP